MQQLHVYTIILLLFIFDILTVEESEFKIDEENGLSVRLGFPEPGLKPQ